MKRQLLTEGRTGPFLGSTSSDSTFNARQTLNLRLSWTKSLISGRQTQEVQ